MGLEKEYEAIAEIDVAGGLFFEWWDGIKDVKHGEVRPQNLPDTFISHLEADLVFGYAFHDIDRPTPNTPAQQSTAPVSSRCSTTTSLPT